MKLSPEAASIDNTNWNLSITSRKLFVKLLVQNIYLRFPREFRGKIKGCFVKNNPQCEQNISNNKMCFLEQIENCKAIGDYLPHLKNGNIVENCNGGEFSTLFTIASYIEDYESRRSTIEKYCDNDFA